MAIRNIRHGGLRRFFERGDASKLHPADVNRTRAILLSLDGADTLDELSEPFYRLHPLKGQWHSVSGWRYSLPLTVLALFLSG